MNTTNKHSIIYSFRLIEGKEEDFVHGWTELTKLIYEFCGSYGSRLHKAGDLLYVAYAQWPDRETRERSNDKLPASANDFRDLMRDSCTEIKTEFEMDVVQDLIRENRYNE